MNTYYWMGVKIESNLPDEVLSALLDNGEPKGYSTPAFMEWWNKEIKKAKVEVFTKESTIKYAL